MIIYIYKFICINKMTLIDRIIDFQTIETRLKIESDTTTELSFISSKLLN